MIFVSQCPSVLLTSGGVLTASVGPRRHWILGVTFCDIETERRTGGARSTAVWAEICGQYQLLLIAVNNKITK